MIRKKADWVLTNKKTTKTRSFSELEGRYLKILTSYGIRNKIINKVLSTICGHRTPARTSFLCFYKFLSVYLKRCLAA